MAGSVAIIRGRVAGAGHADLLRRVTGSICGLSTGDMLGGCCARASKATLSQDAEAALFHFSQTGLALDVLRVSDDTLLALEALASINKFGFVFRSDVATRFMAMDTRGGFQIEKLRKASDAMYLPADGLTNGAVLRAAPIAYLYGSRCMVDILYDTHKLASITHGHPIALAAAAVLGTTIALAVEGEPAASIMKSLSELADPICRTCGGGELVFSNLIDAFDITRRYGFADSFDVMEASLGLSVDASSSAVVGIALGLTHPNIRIALPYLLRRNRRGWDLDSTAAIYGAVSGAIHPETAASNIAHLLLDDIGFDLQSAVTRLLRHRQRRERRMGTKLIDRDCKL